MNDNRKYDIAVAELLGLEEEAPFYHQDAALAIQALELICDEREITPHLHRESCGEWTVILYSLLYSGQEITRRHDASLPLAIVKTLARSKVLC